MLMTCPECELQVSDKAIACPHCGFPFQPNVAKERKKKVFKKNKRRRLPNGFGSITKIENQNLRKAYRVEITVGKNSKGRPIRKLLKPDAYFETYNDAYAALVEYNRNPYDLDDCITVKELYEKWSDTYFKTLKNPSSMRSISSAWNYCSEIYDYRAKDLRARHIKGCMDNGSIIDKNGKNKKASADTKSRIKSLFNLMYDYAVEYELVDKNYARTFKVSDDILNEKSENKQPHIPFSDEERNILWDNVNKVPYVDVILIQLYSGWRPQELGLIKIENVDLNTWIFVGGMKTDAGRNRSVPIHTKIRELVKKRYDEAKQLNSEFLFNCIEAKKGGYFLSYDKYSYRFSNVIKKLSMNQDHRAHDPRIDFITRAKKAGVDPFAIKILVGHEVYDVTEKVYTKRDIEWLRKDIELIE